MNALHGLAAPFFLCDLDRATAKYRLLESAFAAHFPRLIVAYSYKTNYVPLLCRHLHELGAHAEVVSKLELELARALGVAGDRIVFNGPGKSCDDIAGALAAGSKVNLDSLEEVRCAVRSSQRRQGRRPGVGLRLAVPLPESGGSTESRLGLSPRRGELERAIAELGAGGVPISGLHVHLSTRARSLAVYEGLCQVLVDVARSLPRGELAWVDVGGGFGFAPPMATGLSFPDFPAYAAAIAAALASGPFDFSRTALVIEPGISLVGDCCAFLAPVLAVKARQDRDLVVVDGSVQLVRPTRHRHRLPLTLLRRDFGPAAGPPRSFDVVGYTCMEDDYLATDVELPPIEVGDVLRFDNVGAYTFVFKPPFIRGAPPIFVVEGGRASIARREERSEDVFRDYVY